MSQYKVVSKVWSLGGLATKAGEMVQVEEIGDGCCSVRHSQMSQAVWATYVDLNAHCQEVSRSSV